MFTWHQLDAWAAIPIQQWTTNGAKVLFVETHVIPVIDVNVDFDAGSRRDPAAKSGLAGLTNASLDKGIRDARGIVIAEAEILDTFADVGAARSNQCQYGQGRIFREGTVGSGTIGQGCQYVVGLAGESVFPS